MPENETCPYLVQVIADRLWLYPVSIYCTSRPRTRVPRARTIADVCANAAYTECPGYLAARRATVSSCISASLDM